MSVYKLKGLAKRGAAFAMAVGLLSGIALWAVPELSFADALNPLTERTLLLSSSSPGFHYKDASGNTTYAPPGSGPNGKQTGETFSFRVSTDSRDAPTGTGKALKAFTFQYCTTAAGECTAPGNNRTDAACTTAPTTPCDNDDFASTSDLNVHYPSPVQNTDFEIWVDGTKDTSASWSMAATNKEDGAGALTGQNNFITLTTSGAGLKPTAGNQIKIVFKASATNYITNPGDDAFFVKINDFDTNTNVDAGQPDDGFALDPLWTDTDGDPNPHIVDGGVTVANVMTDSIQIQTKVLETMAFSVGTENPDLVDVTEGGTQTGVGHGACDAIEVNNPLKLGLSTEEFSLRVDQAFDAHSYWRLSSNSSNGASVYYSGYTLSNTENDQINAIGTTAAASNPGQEQFGLAYDGTVDTADLGGDVNDPDYPSSETPSPLNVLDGTSGTTNYAGGAGTITDAGTARFAFNTASSTVPELLAQENTDVVDCATGKMRYMANIGASTPAGIYTAAINYLAAPEY
jgi:hypothetical protein